MSYIPFSKTYLKNLFFLGLLIKKNFFLLYYLGMWLQNDVSRDSDDFPIKKK